jgi:hypothetical protein
MSGSAGIAAAKRRRAGPSNTINEVPKRPSPPSAPVPVVQAPPVNTHPLLLLSQHEQQILKIQEQLAEYRNHSKGMDEKSIDYFRQQYENMSSEIQEMKKLLIKIQTFSMEVNLELLKMKRLLKNDPRMKEEEETTGLDKLKIDDN